MADATCTVKRALSAIFFGAATWGSLIAVSLVLEYLFNSPAPPGLQGMPPIPAFFLYALFLGWIPAMYVGVQKFRRAGKPMDEQS